MQSAANRQASRGRARIIGINRMSGGMGKNELSTKDTASSAAKAFGPAARRRIRSYRACSIYNGSAHNPDRDCFVAALLAMTAFARSLRAKRGNLVGQRAVSSSKTGSSSRMPTILRADRYSGPLRNRGRRSGLAEPFAPADQIVLRQMH